MSVYLRKMEMEDKFDIYQITSDEIGGKFMRSGAHKDISQVEELIDKFTKNENMGFSIIDEKSNKLVGYIGLETEDNSSFGMSMMMSPNYRGKGCGTFVISKMIELLEDEKTPIKRLQAHVLANNVASCTMLEKNGFKIIETFHFNDCPQGLHFYVFPN